MLFRGECPDPEIWEDCRGHYWSGWIRLFLPLINNQVGYFVHFPFGDNYMDQPATTMRILQAIQNEYHAYLKEANKIGGV